MAHVDAVYDVLMRLHRHAGVFGCQRATVLPQSFSSLQVSHLLCISQTTSRPYHGYQKFWFEEINNGFWFLKRVFDYVLYWMLKVI